MVRFDLCDIKVAECHQFGLPLKASYWLRAGKEGQDRLICIPGGFQGVGVSQYAGDPQASHYANGQVQQRSSFITLFVNNLLQPRDRYFRLPAQPRRLRGSEIGRRVRLIKREQGLRDLIARSTCSFTRGAQPGYGLVAQFIYQESLPAVPHTWVPHGNIPTKSGLPRQCR